MPSQLEVDLLAAVVLAGLPDQEPIRRWMSEPGEHPGIWAEDRVLLLEGGLVEYEIEPSGAVQVRDNRDPRAMRFQRYERGRPQPYFSPWPDFDVPAA